MNWKKYILNVDTLVAIAIVCLVLYFIFTSKRKKYRFDISIDGTGTGRPKIATRKKKYKVNKHEEECRRIFQGIFGVRFKSVRPKWLKNPVTNKNLELDGYNPSIITPIGKGLAFEYDGQQHSTFTPHFHKNGPDEFKYQVTKDAWKTRKCKERGVMLVRIPHFVAFQDLERYIKMEINRLEIKRGLYS